MMEPQIKEDKVLEFKALTMSKRIFEQLREVKADSVVRVIGWVNDPPGIWFIGTLASGNTEALVRVRWMDMADFIHDQLGGHGAVAEIAKALHINPAELMRGKMGEYRDSLPQIFLK